MSALTVILHRPLLLATGLALCGAAQAATIGQASISSKAAPAGGYEFTYAYALSYTATDKAPCGARAVFGGGQTMPPQLFRLVTPQPSVTVKRTVTAPGEYPVIMEGFAHGGLVACQGSASAIGMVPAPAPSSGGSSSGTTPNVPKVDVNKKTAPTPPKPGEIKGFNPQPEPPLNRTLSKVKPGEDKGFNPQPEPPLNKPAPQGK